MKGILLLLLLVPYTYALDFSGPGTLTETISIPYSQINGFSFDVTGSDNAGLPTNVRIDVGNNGHTDWTYNVYNTNTPLQLREILTAYSTNPSEVQLGFVNLVADTPVSRLDTYGTLTDNVFFKSETVDTGYLAIIMGSATDQQIVSITTDDTTTHAFLPDSPEPSGAQPGYYVAEGGSTYYCNTDHDFVGSGKCNLNAQEAITPAHLAASGTSGFDFTETINNPEIKNTINNILATCPLPCNIDIAVSSDSRGTVDLSNFIIIPPNDPPIIELAEEPTDYRITITPTDPLTDVYAFYGKMPDVFVVPFMDNGETLTAEETQKLSFIQNNLVQAWDSLTNNSYPMHFKFLSPYTMNIGTYNDFVDYRIDTMVPWLNATDPSILITIDIKNHFPNVDSNNVRRTGDTKAHIFINGEKDIYRWDEELILNLILHELAHTFIRYPETDQFYTDHPASYTNLPDFDTYAPASSPTGSEGYFEIYSVMNQLRPFISSEELGELRLSLLDQMLMGIKSPYTTGDYTFYSGTVSKSGNKYQTSAMTSAATYNARETFLKAEDSMLWSVLDTPVSIFRGTSTSFTIQKENTNESLWVFAEDLAHPGHFRCFNVGESTSSIAVIPNPIIITDAYVNDTTITTTDTDFTLTLVFSEPTSDPTISFSPALNLACQGSWSGADYYYDCNLGTLEIESNIDLSVTGSASYNENDIMTINRPSTNPIIITDAYVNDTTITATDTDFTLTLVFSEVTSVPTISFSPALNLTCQGSWSGADYYYDCSLGTLEI